MWPCVARYNETMLGTSLAFYRGQKSFSPENFQKLSEKGFPGRLGPEAEKARKRVENVYF